MSQCARASCLWECSHYDSVASSHKLKWAKWGSVDGVCSKQYKGQRFCSQWLGSLKVCVIPPSCCGEASVSAALNSTVSFSPVAVKWCRDDVFLDNNLEVGAALVPSSKSLGNVWRGNWMCKNANWFLGFRTTSAPHYFGRYLECFQSVSATQQSTWPVQ